MGNIPDYPAPGRPLTDADQLAAWIDGKQVALPAKAIKDLTFQDPAFTGVVEQVGRAVGLAQAATTLASLYAAAAIAAAGGVYASVSDGLAATADGKSFLVADASNLFATVYRRQGTAAIDTGFDVPSYQAVYSALGGATSITPTNFADSIETVNKGGYYETSALARTFYTTSATSLTISAFTTIYGDFPQWAEIGVYSDGVWIGQVSATANGAYSGAIALPAGANKKVQLVNGLRSKVGGVVKGTYLVKVDANAPILQIRAMPVNLTVNLSDSIGVCANATHPAQSGFLPRFRAVTNDSIVAMGYGFNTFMEQAGNASLRAALVAKLKAAGAKRFNIQTITNDWALLTATPDNFQAAIAALLDLAHAEIPDLQIVAIGAIIRGDEGTNNGLGFPIAAYRAAMSAACAGRAWAVYTNGKAYMGTSFLDDGVHPTDSGHLKLAQGLGPLLGYTVPDAPVSTAALNAGPDANGAVTTPAAGVLRYTKNAGGNGFNAGAYGGLRGGDFRYQIDPLAGQDLFIGYGAAPSNNSGFGDMAHALYLAGGGGMSAYDAGSPGAGPAFTNWVPGNADLGRFWVDRTGSALTIRQGATYAGARTLLTYAGVTGTIGLDYCLFQQGGAFDVRQAA